MSKQVDKKYQDFLGYDIIFTHNNLGISFDDRATQNEVLNLLRFNCPMKDCGEICGSWKELKRHTQEKHQLRFCDLCTRHKKQFTNEFELYNARDLSRHERDGDDKGFSGHPRCSFCNSRFYSNDELFVHLRENHEKCPICTTSNPSKPQYFKDSAALQEHFRSAHYPCMVQSCIDLKLVAFKDEIDLRAHMIEQHPLLYGNSKAARTLDLDFGFKGFQSKLSTVGSSDTSSSNNKGKSKCKSDGSEPSSNTGSSAPLMENSQETFPSLAPKGRQQFSTLSVSFGQPSGPVRSARKDTPADLARRRLDERVRNSLNYDAGKFAQFESINEKFIDSQIEANGLINEYKRLFPKAGTEELDAMIRDFSKINFKQIGRVKALNKAWEEQNMKSHYPSLGREIHQRPVGSGAWASQTTKKNKNGESSDGQASNAFPLLPPAPKSRFPPVSAPVSRSASPSVNFGNLSGSGKINRKAPQTMNYSSPTRTTSSPSLASSEFPALPVAKPKKKYSMVLTPRSVEPHGSNVTILTPPRASDETSDVAIIGANGNANRKGKGKKKQLLYHIGV